MKTKEVPEVVTPADAVDAATTKPDVPAPDWRTAPWGQGMRRRYLSHAARTTLELRQSELSLWHGILFVFNVGIPALFGVLTGEMRAGVVGAVAGMIFSVTDSDDPIGIRLLLLCRTLLMLLVFGTLGTLWGGYTLAFWITFLALTFLTGWLSVFASSWTAGFRNGAIALITTAGLPGSTGTTALFVVLAACVSAATRSYGAWRFPDAPTVLPPAKPFEAARGWIGLRYCAIYAGAVALGLLIGKMQGVERPVWVATTVLLIMQPEASASYRRSIQRVFGTLVGVLAAALVVTLFHSLLTLGLAVVLIAFAFPHGAARSYWVQSAFVAWLILVLYDFGVEGRGFEKHLLSERVRDAFEGGILALVATLFAFSRWPFNSSKAAS